MEIPPFDHSHIAPQTTSVFYPEVLIHRGRYFSSFKVTVDRRNYIYERCNEVVLPSVI